MPVPARSGTQPSALALILFAFGVAEWSGQASSGAVHGLKVVAVAVVAQAVWGIAKSLCLDRLRSSSTAIGAALVVLHARMSPVVVVAIAAAAGWGLAV